MPHKSKTSMPHKSKTSMPHKSKTSMPHKSKTMKRKVSIPYKKKTLKRKTSMHCKKKTKVGGTNTTTFTNFMNQNYSSELSENNNRGFLFKQLLLTLTYIPEPKHISEIKTKKLNLKLDRNDKNLFVIKSFNKDINPPKKIENGDIITEIIYDGNSYQTNEMNDNDIKTHFKQKNIMFKIIRPLDLSFNFYTKKFIFTGDANRPTHKEVFNKLISVFTNYNNNYTKLVDGNFFEFTDIKKKTYFHNINNNYIKLKEFVNTKIKGINIRWNKTDNDGFDIILTLQNVSEPKLIISKDLQTAKYNKSYIELKDGNPSENKSDIMISHLRSDNLKKLVSVLVLGNEQKGNVNNNIIQLTGLGQVETINYQYNIDINNKDNINEAAKQLGLFTDEQINKFNEVQENPLKVETLNGSSPYKYLLLKYKDKDVGYIEDKKTIKLYKLKKLDFRDYLEKNTSFFTKNLGMENNIEIIDYQF